MDKTKKVEVMEPVHFRLPKETMDKVRKVAKKEQRNLSQTIRILLDSSLTKR